MKKLCLFIISLCGVFECLGCSKSSLLPDEQENQNTEQVGTSTFSKESGNYAETTINYRKGVINPTDDTRPALCLFLHGGSRRGDDNEIQLTEEGVAAIVTYLQTQQISAVFLIPQCPYGSSWGEMTEALRALLDSVVAGGTVDPNRIYVFGGSMGGTGTWQLVSNNPNFFAAAMPVAGNPIRCDVEAVATTPIYTVMGVEDRLMSIDNVESFLGMLSSVGGIYKFDTESDWSHKDTCTKSYTDERLEWIFSQKRK